jgi:flagellar hook assembly protein FlgD
VDFDPVIGGVAPTGETVAGTRALVTSVVAQPVGAGASITFSLSAQAAVTVQVANIAGRPVRTLVVPQPMAPGLQSVVWDGRSEAGTPAPTGLYMVTVTSLTPDGGRSQAVVPLRLQRR